VKILIATDGAPDAAAALESLAALPLPPGSAVHVVSVVTDPRVPVGPFGEPPFASWEALEELHEAERRAAAEAVEEAAARLAREGVAVTSAVRVGGAAHEILQAAAESGAELVVLGGNELTAVEEFFLGSVARNVAKHADRPVLIARAPRHGLKRVVLAVDGSEHAARATAFVARLPLPPETEVQAVHVVRPYRPHRSLLAREGDRHAETVEELRRQYYEAAAELVEGARSELEAAGKRAAAAIGEGDPTREILGFAAAGEADLIVAGARGVSVIQGLLVGNVADRLLKSAPGSVLLVH
jgi:nucleotide-binding universal stress UspA family protein